MISENNKTSVPAHAKKAGSANIVMNLANGIPRTTYSFKKNMRSTFKLLSKFFPIAGCAVIIYLAVVHGDTLFQDSQFSTIVRITYTAVFAYAMEYISRYLHCHLWHCKYLWWIHGSHHHQYPAIGSKPTYDHGNPFVSPAVEFNDVFAIVFASIATGLMWIGVEYPATFAKDCSAGMGIGVTIYGFSYFLGHDIVAHERCGKGIARAIRNVWPYLDECVSVHVRYHHKVKKRDDQNDPYGGPYGFWLGPSEVQCLESGHAEYVPMSVFPKLLVSIAVGLHVMALILS